MSDTCKHQLFKSGMVFKGLECTDTAILGSELIPTSHKQNFYARQFVIDCCTIVYVGIIQKGKSLKKENNRHFGELPPSLKAIDLYVYLKAQDLKFVCYIYTVLKQKITFFSKICFTYL